MWEALSSGEKFGPYSVAFVDRCCTPVAGGQLRPALSRRCRHEGIVGGAAGHVVLGQPEYERPVGLRGEPQERLRKSCLNEIANYRARTAVRGWKACEHGIRFECTVLDQAHAAVEHTPGRFVILMPGSKRGHDQAGVGRSYLRTRSNVSRT